MYWALFSTFFLITAAYPGNTSPTLHSFALDIFFQVQTYWVATLRWLIRSIWVISMHLQKCQSLGWLTTIQGLALLLLRQLLESQLLGVLWSAKIDTGSCWILVVRFNQIITCGEHILLLLMSPSLLIFLHFGQEDRGLYFGDDTSLDLASADGLDINLNLILYVTWFS